MTYCPAISGRLNQSGNATWCLAVRLTTGVFKIRYGTETATSRKLLSGAQDLAHGTLAICYFRKLFTFWASAATRIGRE
jgi:hypothetical protein